MRRDTVNKCNKGNRIYAFRGKYEYKMQEVMAYINERRAKSILAVQT